MHAVRRRRPGSSGHRHGGVIRTRFLVPSKLGDSPASAELITASITMKVAVAHRIQAAELKQGPWKPTSLYLDALAVLHGTATDQVSREMKYLAAKLATVKEARSGGKIKTAKICQSCHPAGILTKPLQGKEFEFKRARLLGLRTRPPAGPGPGTDPSARAGTPEREGPPYPQGSPPGPPPVGGAGRWAGCSDWEAAEHGPGKTVGYPTGPTGGWAHALWEGKRGGIFFVSKTPCKAVLASVQLYDLPPLKEKIAQKERGRRRDHNIKDTAPPPQCRVEGRVYSRTSRAPQRGASLLLVALPAALQCGISRAGERGSHPPGRFATTHN